MHYMADKARRSQLALCTAVSWHAALKAKAEAAAGLHAPKSQSYIHLVSHANLMSQAMR